MSEPTKLEKMARSISDAADGADWFSCPPPEPHCGKCELCATKRALEAIIREAAQVAANVYWHDGGEPKTAILAHFDLKGDGNV